MKPLLAAAMIAAFPTLSPAEVTITDPWARATIVADRPGAGYLTLTSDRDDRLLSVSSPDAGMVMIHVIEPAQNGASRMVHLDALDLPAGETVTLAPGDMHLMLMQLERKLEEGATVPLTLTFEVAGEVTVDLSVLGVGATGPEGTE